MKKLQSIQLEKVQFDSKVIVDAWQSINGAKKITFLTHRKPDGDGISACAALSYILEPLDKSVETVYPDKPEFEYKRPPKNLFIGKHVQAPDLIIACDTANYDRLYWPKAFYDIPVLNIDHHVSNSIKGAYNFIDSQASSACEVLYDLLICWDKQLIDSIVAELLLFGILYDSRVFYTQSTSSNTLRIAANLMDRGANLFALKMELFSNKNPEIIKLWGTILNRIEISKNKRAAWSYITQDDLKKRKLTLSSLVGFINFLSDLSDVDVTMLFYETETGQTKVSLRSIEYDVNKLAAQFDGGGHKNAAGILSDKSLEEFMGEVVAVL